MLSMACGRDLVCCYALEGLQINHELGRYHTECDFSDDVDVSRTASGTRLPESWQREWRSSRLRRGVFLVRAMKNSNTASSPGVLLAGAWIAPIAADDDCSSLLQLPSRVRVKPITGVSHEPRERGHCHGESSRRW